MEIKKRTLLVLAALSQETRLDIFRVLVQAGPLGLAAGEISNELDLSPSTCSFHLKELRNGNVVDSYKRGRSIVYRVNFEGLQTALSYILEDCCQGGIGQLGGKR